MTKENRILSVRNLEVKFQVRGRFLTAIRNVSFDVFDQEILAIVGESGSGKSVITKTFTGMLESNGWVSNGSIVYRPNETTINDDKAYFKKPIDLVNLQKPLIDSYVIKSIIKTNKEKIKILRKEINRLNSLNPSIIEKKQRQLIDRVDLLNAKLKHETIKQKQEQYSLEIKQLEQEFYQIFENNKDKSHNISIKNIEKLESQIQKLEKNHKFVLEQAQFATSSKAEKKLVTLEFKLEKLKDDLKVASDNNYRDKKVLEILLEIEKCDIEISKIKPLTLSERKKINKIIDYIAEYSQTNSAFSEEQKLLIDEYFISKKYLNRFEAELEKICDSIIYENNFDNEHFNNILVDWTRIKHSDFNNKIKALKEIKELRGKTISTVFQDPMTSLNPLLTVGFQLSEVLIKQLGLTRKEAKQEAIELLRKVGITNPEKRYKDIPGRYSGGMRQRVVIVIALACRPKVLICDEPTTALDVTIQAQILKLIKELKQEYKFTVIFITHDLGVVAQIADRVAVMYAGQIIEIGTIDDIFERSCHPYTWALLSSLPQLGTKGQDLFSIEGTPPSLFNEIKGDAFAPRNKYALEIDYHLEPPMFKVSETHFAKTWLLDKRSPKVEKPKSLQNLKKIISESEKVKK